MAKISPNPHGEKAAMRKHKKDNGGGSGSDENRHFSTSLFSGDVMTMRDDCNDTWEHSVLPGQGADNNGARVSLVFKRALISRDGRRGHTLEGQGRRARAARAPDPAGIHSRCHSGRRKRYP